ncbi:MAG: DUF4407 domain-containing protein [Cyclobacteriaceae bacterium]|jgi:hypothetical protein|nr:DUF4407 domain-containing protein [Cyclobacteriaceae bacterium]
MNDLSKFFLFCSGANISLLKRCPTEYNKFIGIGGAVFFTGLFAFISGAFALYYVFNDLPQGQRGFLSLLFGLAWGSMIFNLDRYIVSSMKKSGNFNEEFQYALPRILLAGIIAIVITKPLELQFFHTSIDYKLEDMHQKEIAYKDSVLAIPFVAKITTLKNEILNLERSIKEKENYRDYLDGEARKEADGTGGSGNRGAARIYALKKADAQKAEAEYLSVIATTKPIINSKNQEIKELEQEYNRLRNANNRGAYDGFDKRMAALGAVSRENEVIRIASNFVMLLFLALELSPVLVKLISKRGPYDALLEKHENEIETYAIEQISKNRQKTNERIQITVEASNDAIRTELQGNRDLMSRIVKAEMEIAQVKIDQWKDEQISKIKNEEKLSDSNLQSEAA